MLCAFAAVAALVLEYGFRREVVDVDLLHIAEVVIVGVFVLDRLARLFTSPSRRRFLQDNFVDFALMAIALVALAVSFRTVLRYGSLYVVITQSYLLASLLLRGVSLNLHFAGSGLHPSWLLIGSFVLLILIGSGLLMLPVAVHADHYDQWHWPDAMFTATSATCVTGLVVVNTGGQFTAFGQAVILAMIQCGGLGIMLFGTMLGLLLGKALTMRQSDTLGKMMSTSGTGKITRIAAFVVLITFAFELVGAIGLHSMYAGGLDTFGVPLSRAGAIWHAVFHSVSSFCNAGFALYGNNMMQGVREGWSVPALRSHWQIMGIMAPLIVIGGLGFPVLANCGAWANSRIKQAAVRFRAGSGTMANTTSRVRLTLQSKIVLTTSLSLILVGAGVLMLVEPRQNDSPRIGRHRFDPSAKPADDWQTMPTGQRAVNSLFQSVTARTAGFNTIDMAELSNAGKLWMCLLMIIGGSPAGTAGGMKTVTFALLVLVAISQLRRRPEVEIFRRSLAPTIISRAVALAVLYMGLVATVTILLSVAQGPGYRLVDLLFEACSACGTVGLSTGLTKTLSPSGRWVIIAGMFIGRLGPLTMLAAIASRLRRVDYAYPAENVIIG